ncbi:MAG: hypothetical protein KDA47_00170 [Planctomycetales bacterium]|nr:hypothetical protein [Planctomycetales bacterium]
MLKRLARSAIGLGIVLAAYWLYGMIAVPWIEPPRSAAGDPAPLPPPVSERQAMFESFFPPESWQRTNPKVLESDRGVLLFQEYEPAVDGRIRLYPVTVVFLPKRNDASSPARPVILNAPDGAEMLFDAKLDLTRARVGRFLGGRLIGEIEIHSPPSEPLADDAVTIRTRNVQLDERRIWTTQPVVFRFGPHHGSGRDLRIDLTGEKTSGPGTDNDPLGAVSMLELASVDKLFLQMKGDGLLGVDAASAKVSQNQNNSTATAPAANANTSPIPIEVSCQGPFKFDFRQQVASLSERVHAVRLNRDGPSDELNCELLAIHFRRDRTANSPELKIAKFAAQGNPVNLRAPSVESSAQAESCEFDFATRRIRLNDSKQIKLVHKSYVFQSPSLEYEVPEDPKRLGRLWAAGPGEMNAEMPDKQRPQPLKATWRRELRVEPADGRHVLSLSGAYVDRNGKPLSQPPAANDQTAGLRPATVEAPGIGWFAAGQLFVWLNERVVARANNASPTSKTQYTLEPDHILAVERVEFDSGKLAGGTQRLEAWVREGARPARMAAVDPFGPSRPATGPRDWLTDSGRGGEQKFDVRGEVVNMYLGRDADELWAEEVDITGRVNVTQIGGTQPEQRPLQINGEELKLRGLAENAVQAIVVGQPASISAQGLELMGAAVQMDQAQNLAWINGGGQITLAAEVLAANSFNRSPAGPTSTPTPLENMPPATLRWTGEMVFDGATLRCEQFVQVDGTHQLKDGTIAQMSMIGDVAEATLVRPIDFRNPDVRGRSDLLTVSISGQNKLVQMVNRTFDTAGNQQSFEQLHSRRLTLNKQSGEFDAAGPGWVSTIRYLSDPLQKRSAGAAPVAASPYLQSKLTYLRVDYQRAIIGNYFQRQVEFLDGVVALSGPVRGWDDVVQADRLERLRDDEKRLTCDRLTVAEMNDGHNRWMELSAAGNAHADGRTRMGYFTAASHRMSYTQAKDLLVLESNGRDDAKLTRQLAVGSPESTVTARKIEFRPKTNELNMDGIGSINLSDLPKFPRR